MKPVTNQKFSKNDFAMVLEFIHSVKFTANNFFYSGNINFIQLRIEKLELLFEAKYEIRAGMAHIW